MAHKRHLQEFKEQRVFGVHRCKRRIVGKAGLLFFQLADNFVGGMPFFDEVARTGRMDGVVLDEAKKLLQRWTADQIQVFARIRLRILRSDGLRDVRCHFWRRRRIRFLPEGG